MKLIKQLWQYIKDKLHGLDQQMTNRHDQRMALDRKEYLKEVTEESIKMFNFVEDKDSQNHYGTLNGVKITLLNDDVEGDLLHHLSTLRELYVEQKMEEYDNGKNS